MTNPFESLLFYHFSDPALLEEALTHPSISNETGKHGGLVNYERLEFLGDAVLGLVIADFLIQQYPNEPEGDLAKRRAALVCHEALAEVGRTMRIGEYLKMTEGEESIGGRENPANLENAMEAVIGALYMDGGLMAVKKVVYEYWMPLLNTMKTPPKDPKTALQEWSQAAKLGIPEYHVLAIEGPSHAPEFIIEVRLPGIEPCTAKGHSKRLAQREAARKLLDKIAGQKETE